MTKSRLAAEILMTGLGIILSMVPVLLWVAWSPRVFALVLLVTGVGAALLIALNDRQELADADSQAEQHDRIEKAEFRRFMDRIRRLAR